MSHVYKIYLDHIYLLLPMKPLNMSSCPHGFFFYNPQSSVPDLLKNNNKHKHKPLQATRTERSESLGLQPLANSSFRGLVSLECAVETERSL